LYPNLIEHPTQRAIAALLPQCAFGALLSEYHRGAPPGAGKPEEDSHMQSTCGPNSEGGQG